MQELQEFRIGRRPVRGFLRCLYSKTLSRVAKPSTLFLFCNSWTPATPELLPLHRSQLPMEAEQETEEEEQSEPVDDGGVEYKDVQSLMEVILFRPEKHVARF